MVAPHVLLEMPRPGLASKGSLYAQGWPQRATEIPIQTEESQQYLPTTTGGSWIRPKTFRSDACSADIDTKGGTDGLSSGASIELSLGLPYCKSCIQS